VKGSVVCLAVIVPSVRKKYNQMPTVIFGPAAVHGTQVDKHCPVQCYTLTKMVIENM
jgi:hypothetical protein